MRRIVLAAVAAVIPLVGVAAQGAQSTPVPGTDLSLTLLDAPPAGPDDPAAAIYLVEHTAPGTTLRRRVQLSNTAPAPAVVSLYAAAATVEAGRFNGADGRAGNELSGWTTVDPPTRVLAPGETVAASVSIAVPPQAAPGERYAVVWAEVPPVRPAGGVAVVNRVGLRVYVSVGAGPEPASDFTVESVTAARGNDGQPQVQAGVRNTGGRALDFDGELRLREGPAGASAGPFRAVPGATTLAPGQSGEVSVLLAGLVGPGPWRAELLLRSGGARRSADVRLTFPAEPGGRSDPVSTQGPGGAPRRGDQRRLAAAAAGANLLVVVGHLLFGVPRRRRAGPAPDPG